MPIDPALRTFLESGLPITLATRDDELQPDGAWAWAAQVDADGERLTLFVYEGSAEGSLRNLRAHPEIAAVFDRPTDHRACQVKGLFEAARPARDDERALVEGQVAATSRELEAIGIPPALTAGWKTWPCVAIRLRVTHLFEQTPGPGTGGPLA